MKPVTQLRTGKPRGQCTEASIASLLECSLEEVPDLLEPGLPDDAPLDQHRPDWRFERLLHWIIEEHGRALCVVLFKAPRATIRECWKEALPVLRQSILAEGVGFDRCLPWYLDHLAAGHNPDQVMHYVVGHRGGLVWDPNPLRRGIVDCNEISWLVPLDLLRQREQAIELGGLQWNIE